MLFYARLTNILGDGPALATTFSIKNHAGTKPCALLCANVINAGYLDDEEDPLPSPGNLLVDIACFDSSKFIRMKDNDVFSYVDALSAAYRDVLAKRSSKTAFVQAEQLSGFAHNPLGLLQCPKLRDLLEPTSLLTYDWSHIYLSNGIGGTELAALLSKLKSDGIGHGSLRSETTKWKFPSFVRMRGYCGKSLAGMFSDKRASNTAHGYSTSASEFLYVAPTILYFLQVTLGVERRKGLEGPIESFRRLNNVIDIIQAHKHNLLSDPELLAHAIGEHQRLYVALYGNHVLPKHHWSLHLPDQIRREIAASSPTQVLDTFTNERHHQIPKSFAEAKKKLEGFEQSVLIRSITNQAQLISRLSETPQLTRREWHEEAGAHIGVSIQYTNLTLSRGDVVIVDGISAKRIAWAGITAPDEHAFLMVENCYYSPLASASIAIKPMGTFTTVWLASVRISLPHGWHNADDGWMHVAINSTCKILA